MAATLNAILPIIKLDRDFVPKNQSAKPLNKSAN